MLSIVNFKVFIIPASKGCNLDVVLAGRKSILMLEKESFRSRECEDTLSRRRRMFQFCHTIFLFNFDMISFMISEFIHALLFE